MELGFVARIIDENWFQEVGEAGRKPWTFERCVSDLSEEELLALIELYCNCTDTRLPSEPEKRKILDDLKTKQAYNGFDVPMSVDSLGKFLHALMRAEYSFDSLLLHPPEMRKKEFDDYAQEVGIDSELLRRIYSNWQDERTRVFK